METTKKFTAQTNEAFTVEIGIKPELAMRNNEVASGVLPTIHVTSIL